MPYQEDELFDTLLDDEEEEKGEESDANDDEFLEPDEPEGKDWGEE